LSGNRYRPHIVIGDPNQRHAITNDHGLSAEEYVGVAFHDGPALPEPGKEMKVVLTLMYFPHPMYDKLTRGGCESRRSRKDCPMARMISRPSRGKIVLEGW
jgi:hypothetical protein